MNELKQQMYALQHTITEKNKIIQENQAILKNLFSSTEGILLATFSAFALGYFMAHKVNVSKVLINLYLGVLSKIMS